MNKFLSAPIKFFIKLAVAAALIIFVLRSGHLRLGALKDLLTGPDILVGLALVGVNLWLLNWRWYWLLRSRGFQIGLSQTFSLYLIGVFFNYALPSSVGGDVVKAYYLARDQKDRRVDSVLSVLIDRVLGLYSLLLMALAGVLFDVSFVLSHPEIKFMAAACALLVAVMSIAFVIGFSGRVERLLGVSRFLQSHPRLSSLAKLFEAMQLFGQQRSAIVVSVIVSVIAQWISVVFFMYVAHALGARDLSWPAFLFCVPIGFVATALPIAPAGVGVGQLAFLYLFQAYSKASGDLGAASITAFQLTMLAWGLVGAVIYVRYKKLDS